MNVEEVREVTAYAQKLEKLSLRLEVKEYENTGIRDISPGRKASNSSTCLLVNSSTLTFNHFVGFVEEPAALLFACEMTVVE